MNISRPWRAKMKTLQSAICWQAGPTWVIERLWWKLGSVWLQTERLSGSPESDASTQILRWYVSLGDALVLEALWPTQITNPRLLFTKNWTALIGGVKHLTAKKKNFYFRTKINWNSGAKTGPFMAAGMMNSLTSGCAHFWATVMCTILSGTEPSLLSLLAPVFMLWFRAKMAAMEKVCWVVYSNTQLIFFRCLLPGPHMLTNCHPITTNYIFFVFVGMTTCGEL